MSATVLSAQTVNVHFKNGQTIRFNSSNVDFVDFSEKAPDPTLSAGSVVDLGLSVYWASCNLGAEKPEEYGNYYAWGETEPKSSYTETNYSYYDNDKKVYMDIGDNIAGTEYDAATVNLGSDWRMPTKEEMQELIDKCTWEWAQISGINGFKVTGTNGNSIFLPAAGFYGFGKGGENDRIRYWTSLKQSSNIYIYILEKSSNSCYISSLANYFGMPIRAVTTNPNANITPPIDHSKDYLVTDKISASFAGGAYSSINGRISSGSQLSWRFTNGSTESVVLTDMVLINGATGAEGNNMLTEQVTVEAGKTAGYTVTIGAGGIQQPKIRFSYMYNQKKYSVEASMPSSTF